MPLQIAISLSLRVRLIVPSAPFRSRHALNARSGFTYLQIGCVDIILGRRPRRVGVRPPRHYMLCPGRRWGRLMCRPCGGRDSRPRGRPGLAIYPSAARDGRRGRPRGVHLENRIPQARPDGGTRGPTPRTDRLFEDHLLGTWSSGASGRVLETRPSPRRIYSYSIRQISEEWIRTGDMPGRPDPVRVLDFWTESSILAQDERWRRA